MVPEWKAQPPVALRHRMGVSLRRAGEPVARFRIKSSTVNSLDTVKTLSPRAQRLHREALNCLQLAVGEKAESFAAQLIDEAVRLMRRSAELSRG